MNENTMTIEAVEREMVELEERFIFLYQRHIELNNVVTDKRKKFNLIRNLKISANRSYQWARRAGCTAHEARERAIAATKESMLGNREDESVLWQLLIRIYKVSTEEVSVAASIPDAVMDYIDLKFAEYVDVENSDVAEICKVATTSI